jgi:hypothetical protein
MGMDVRVTGQAGRARAPLIAGGALLVLAMGGGLAWRAASTRSQLPVRVSAANAQSAQSKMDALEQARAAAARAGHAVQVVETFSDAELSALANAQARARQLPFRDLSLHATAAGTVRGDGLVRVGGQELPLTLEVVPDVSADDRVHLRVTSIHVGTLPLPGAVADQVTHSISQALDLGQPPAGYQHLRVEVADGRLTISGTAGP